MHTHKCVHAHPVVFLCVGGLLLSKVVCMSRCLLCAVRFGLWDLKSNSLCKGGHDLCLHETAQLAVVTVITCLQRTRVVYACPLAACSWYHLVIQGWQRSRRLSSMQRCSRTRKVHAKCHLGFLDRLPAGRELPARHVYRSGESVQPVWACACKQLNSHVATPSSPFASSQQRACLRLSSRSGGVQPGISVLQ